jgi:hypothetical protein
LARGRPAIRPRWDGELQNFIICLAAFLASGLTLFSGFSLGTLLLPVMALMLPAIAVGLTCFLGVAVMHFGWWRTLINLGWRLARRDPDDFDCHFPG